MSSDKYNLDNKNQELSNLQTNEIIPDSSSKNIEHLDLHEHDSNEPKVSLFHNKQKTETDFINIKSEGNLDAELKEDKPEEQNVKEEENENKTCWQKFISQFKTGTMVNSVFNISIISLGSGLFAIPVKVQYMTLAFAPVYVILAGIANMVSLLMISFAVDKTNILDFYQIALKTLGKPFAVMINIGTIGYSYGLVILFQVMVYKLLGGIINDIGGYDYESLNDFVEKSFWRKYSYKFIVCYGICLVILMPFCLKRNIGEMKLPTYIGVVSLFVVVLIIIIQSPFFIDNYYDEVYKEDDDSTHLNVYDLSRGADKNLNIIRPFVTLFFAYTSQNAVFPIIEAVKDRTKQKIDKVFYISSIIDCIIYILMAILGYLTQPIDTPDLIIERKSIFKKDYFMIAGRMLLTLTLLGKIAPNYNALRVSLLSSLGYDINNYSTFLNCILTIPLILISTLITVLYQKVGDYVDFLGSFASIFFCFLIPGLMYIKLNEYPRYHWKNVLSVIYMVVFIILCAISGGFTVKDIVNNI